MANNSFISDFPGLSSCFPMHACKHHAPRQLYPFQSLLSIFSTSPGTLSTLYERGPPLQSFEPELLDCTAFLSSQPSLCPHAYTPDSIKRSSKREFRYFFPRRAEKFRATWYPPPTDDRVLELVGLKPLNLSRLRVNGLIKRDDCVFLANDFTHLLNLLQDSVYCATFC